MGSSGGSSGGASRKGGMRYYVAVGRNWAYMKNRMRRLMGLGALSGALLWLAVPGVGQEQQPAKAAPEEQSSMKDKPPATKEEQSGGSGDGSNTAETKPKERFGQRLAHLPLVWLIGPYVPPQGPLQPLTAEQREDVYVRQTFLTAGSYFARMFVAGIDQARDYPHDWGGGMPGYGRRFASRYGQFVIANTVLSAGNAALGYEPRYDLCRCQGFWPRSKHAIARNFYTYNRSEVERRPQIPLYAGAFAAGAVSATWTPRDRNPWADGGYSMLIQAGIGSGYNLASEFASDILRKFGVGKKR